MKINITEKHGAITRIDTDVLDINSDSIQVYHNSTTGALSDGGFCLFDLDISLGPRKRPTERLQRVLDKYHCYLNEDGEIVQNVQKRGVIDLTGYIACYKAVQELARQ